MWEKKLLYKFFFIAVIKIMIKATYRRNSLFGLNSQEFMFMMDEQRQQAAGTVVVTGYWGLTPHFTSTKQRESKTEMANVFKLSNLPPGDNQKDHTF